MIEFKSNLAESDDLSDSDLPDSLKDMFDDA